MDDPAGSSACGRVGSLSGKWREEEEAKEGKKAKFSPFFVDGTNIT